MPDDDDLVEDMTPLDDDGEITEFEVPDDGDIGVAQEQEQEKPPRASRSGRNARSGNDDGDGDDDRSRGRGRSRDRSRSRRDRPRPRKGCLGTLFKFFFLIFLGLAGGVAGTIYGVKFLLAEHTKPDKTKDWKWIHDPIDKAAKFIDPGHTRPEGTEPANGEDAPDGDGSAGSDGNGDATEPVPGNGDTTDTDPSPDNPGDVDATDGPIDLPQNNGITESDLQLD